MQVRADDDAANVAGKSGTSAQALSCPVGTTATPGYCIEKLPLPDNLDIGSITREAKGDHLLVYAARRGAWDTARERYLSNPFVIEIWHPAGEDEERSCPFSKWHGVMCQVL